MVFWVGLGGDREPSMGALPPETVRSSIEIKEITLTRMSTMWVGVSADGYRGVVY